MEMGDLLGPMVAHTQENSLIITFMAWEFMNGQMDECTMVTGEIIRWRGTEPLVGLMEEGTWVNTMMI